MLTLALVLIVVGGGSALGIDLLLSLAITVALVARSIVALDLIRSVLQFLGIVNIGGVLQELLPLWYLLC